MSLPKLPEGRQSFADMRLAGATYVDKTELIYQLAEHSYRYCLNAPDGFGKSLLISTLASLFSEGTRHFMGLAIEKLWTDKIYSVVTLDLSRVTDFADKKEFDEKFNRTLAEAFRTAGFVCNKSDRSPAYSQIYCHMRSRPTLSLVLLIDCYDTPLSYAIDKPELFEHVRRIMAGFSEMIKSASGCLRFFLMTGVVDFNNSATLSGFDTLCDISRHPCYGELLGFTREELETHFGAHLDAACEKLSLGKSDLLDSLQEHYGGFRFNDLSETRLFCPNSVLGFFGNDRYGFDNYWFDSAGQPLALMKYLANRVPNAPMKFSETLHMSSWSVLETDPFGKLRLNALLNRTGYLTIRSSERPDSFEMMNSYDVELGYPNLEVAESMSMLYSLITERNENFMPKTLRESFASRNPECLEKFLNKVFAPLALTGLPVGSDILFMGSMQLMMRGAGIDTGYETIPAPTRNHLEIFIDGTRWFLEFRYAETPEEIPGLIEAAAKVCRTPRIDNIWLVPDGTIRAVLVFDGQNNRVVARSLPPTGKEPMAHPVLPEWEPS